MVNILGLQNSSSVAISITDTCGTLVLQHRWEIKNNAFEYSDYFSQIRNLYRNHSFIRAQQGQTKFYKK